MLRAGAAGGRCRRAMQAGVAGGRCRLALQAGAAVHYCATFQKVFILSVAAGVSGGQSCAYSGALRRARGAGVVIYVHSVASCRFISNTDS